MAATEAEISAYAVMRTTGRWGSVSLTRFKTVMPSMPGILTSTSSMSGLATGTICKAVSPS